jgi:Tol biopolymer transport system component
LAVAAAVVIGAAGVRQALVRPPEGPFVAVVEVRGDVTDANGAVVGLGHKLSVGARVKTGEGARVTLVTRRGSQFTLDTYTSLKLASASTAVLESGRVYCRSRGGEIEEIEASPGTIRLLGTTLDAAMEDGDSVAVTVVDGKVRLSNSQGEAEVSAGNRALLVASLRPDSGRPVNVREATAWYYGRSDIVSDFGDIAYLVTREDAQGLASELWMMREDGSSKRRLKTYLGWCQAPGPWLPGQQWLMVNAHSILWSTPDFNNRRAHTGAGHPILDDQAWLINAVTGQDLAFDLPAGTDPLYTDLSPNGARLAFDGRYQPDPNSREGMEGGVWAYDMTTGQMKKLLNGYIKTPLSWAPDSRRIVADTGEGYGLDHPLVVADADTVEIRDLGVNGADGVFSPDGRKIAYVGEFQRGGSWFMGVPVSGRIMVYDLASGKAAPISPADTGALQPRWSPDGRRVAYRVNSGPRVVTIFVAGADGSGSRKIFDCSDSLAGYAWMPDSDALYLVMANGIEIIAANGAGLLADLGGAPDDSVLTAEQDRQTQAALDAVREAVFQFAVGNVRRFEGKPREAKAAFQAVSDIFAGIAWEYPLAQFSVDQLLLYADKAAVEAAKPRAQLLSESCRERLSYLEILLLQYVGAKGEFPRGLAALERHSLENGWGINWISNKDTEWVKLMFRCPDDGPYSYHRPSGAPEIGDVLIACRAHPDHKLVWSMGLAEQVGWYSQSSNAEEEAQLLDKAQQIRDAISYGEATWKDVENAYLAVLKEVPNSQMAKEYLGRIYARRGHFKEALEMLPAYRGGWSALHRAFCYDALGQREKAVAIYQELVNQLGPTDHIGEWAARGLKQPTWMRDLNIPAKPRETRLMPDDHWHASASISWERSSSERASPDRAIDGSRVTNWFTGDGERPGQWFKLEFDEAIPVTRVVLDHHGEQSIYPTGWPRGVTASVTVDGRSWSDVGATRGGIMQPVTVAFEQPRSIKGIRFECTASHQPESWGIFEVFVFAPKQ